MDLRRTAALGDREFERLRVLVRELVGIKLSESKRELVVGRLAKRVHALGLSSFSEYCDLVTGPSGDASERLQLVNCITTNKTDFFREAHHFEFLAERVIAEARARAEAGGPRSLRIWSAGCSTGEEPYTIALTVADALGRELPRWNVQILATDIDTEVLARAKRAIYADERLAPVEWDVRKRHFLRGVGDNAGSWCVRPQTAELVRFGRRNLVVGEWPSEERFDAIFCRNVLIYFDRATQERVVERFAERLVPGGYLFLGHSESLTGAARLFAIEGQTVHRLRGGTTPARRSTMRPRAEASPVTRVERRIVAGEVFASRAPAEVRTLLGSCVSACLFDPIAGVGGMNHFMLPEGDPSGRPPAVFGVHAMERLVNELLRLGADRRRLRAKVVGASSVLDTVDAVPRRNAAFVRAFLETEGIPIDGARLGGNEPLEVHFQTDTGRTLVRAVGEAAHARIVAAERQMSSAHGGADMQPEIWGAEARTHG